MSTVYSCQLGHSFSSAIGKSQQAQIRICLSQVGEVASEHLFLATGIELILQWNQSVPGGWPNFVATLRIGTSFHATQNPKTEESNANRTHFYDCPCRIRVNPSPFLPFSVIPRVSRHLPDREAGRQRWGRGCRISLSLSWTTLPGCDTIIIITPLL